MLRFNFTLGIICMVILILIMYMKQRKYRNVTMGNNEPPQIHMYSTIGHCNQILSLQLTELFIKALKHPIAAV